MTGTAMAQTPPPSRMASSTGLAGSRSWNSQRAEDDQVTGAEDEGNRHDDGDRAALECPWNRHMPTPRTRARGTVGRPEPRRPARRGRGAGRRTGGRQCLEGDPGEPVHQAGAAAVAYAGTRCRCRRPAPVGRVVDDRPPGIRGSRPPRRPVPPRWCPRRSPARGHRRCSAAPPTRSAPRCTPVHRPPGRSCSTRRDSTMVPTSPDACSG